MSDIVSAQAHRELRKLNFIQADEKGWRLTKRGSVLLGVLIGIYWLERSRDKPKPKPTGNVVPLR